MSVEHYKISLYIYIYNIYIYIYIRGILADLYIMLSRQGCHRLNGEASSSPNGVRLSIKLCVTSDSDNTEL